jgi:hypothetical protein
MGKGQKKQNYQTNQSFPFMYPPADDEGGNKLWEDDGGGVPKSIRESGELFSRRTRISLAMRQLWREREAFERYGRGWQVEEPSERKQRWELEDRIPRWEEKRLATVEEIYVRFSAPRLRCLLTGRQ